jgi:hypothetical protein
MFNLPVEGSSSLETDHADSLRTGTLRIFMDEDGNENTGYLIRDLGADYMVEVNGYKSSIHSAKLKKFEPTNRIFGTEPRTQHDWHGWIDIGTAASACYDNELETSVHLQNAQADTEIRAHFELTDSSGNCDSSDAIIIDSGGALILEQKSMAQKILKKDFENRILELKLKAVGEDITVESIDLDYPEIYEPNILIFNNLDEIITFPITIAKGHAESYFVVVNIPNTIGSFEDEIFSLEVSSVKVNKGTVTILGNGVKAYMEAISDEVVIDGLFTDWENINKIIDEDEENLSNLNTDIDNYATLSTSEAMYFYLRSKGNILAGEVIPQEFYKYIAPDYKKDDSGSSNAIDAKSTTTASALPPLPSCTGEDIIYIFMATDNNDQFMIRIKGKHGKITSRELYEISSSELIFIKGIEALNDDTQIEAKISMPDLGNPSKVCIDFVMCDWQGELDKTETDFLLNDISVSTGWWIEQWYDFYYNDELNPELQISEQTSGSRAWNIQTVDTDNAGNYSTSIAIDSIDRPHICYYNTTNSSLKYAKWTGSTWSIEQVDNSGDVGLHTSIAIDSFDYPHISYYNASDNCSLKYAKWNGSGWEIETVDHSNSTNIGQYTSIALDSNDYPHISYLNYSTPDSELKYANWTGTSWNISKVDGGPGIGIIGMYSSIALDQFDLPHISYYNQTGPNLKYARWNLTTWNIEIVERGNATNDIGSHSSLALDSLNRAHISYYNSTFGNLKYAYWNSLSWDISTVDGTLFDNVGMYSSIAVNASDYPCISYFNFTPDDLKYAQWTGSAWVIETVDAIGAVGTYSSLALDDNGSAHISYYDGSNLELKYANNIPEFPILLLPMILALFYIAIFTSRKRYLGVIRK